MNPRRLVAIFAVALVVVLVATPLVILGRWSGLFDLIERYPVLLLLWVPFCMAAGAAAGTVAARVVMGERW